MHHRLDLRADLPGILLACAIALAGSPAPAAQGGKDEKPSMDVMADMKEGDRTQGGTHRAAPSPILGPDTQLKPGVTFRDCEACPDMVVIPPGLFIMGAGATHPRSKPAHRRLIGKPFALGRYEVTFEEYAACVDAGACGTLPDDHKWGTEGRPIINVTFDDAKRYTQWLSGVTGQTYRLPSEAEWEYADRAGGAKPFWWGDDQAGENRANCKDCKSPWSAKGSAPVGSFPPNKFGVYDTVANVFEWVEDCWVESYQGAPKDASPRLDGDCKQRVIRGGSFYYFQKVSRSGYRSKNAAKVKSYWLGFRVARDL